MAQYDIEEYMVHRFNYRKAECADNLLSMRILFQNFHHLVSNKNFEMTSGGDSWAELEDHLAEIDGMFEIIEDQLKEIESFVDNMSPKSLIDPIGAKARREGF